MVGLRSRNELKSDKVASLVPSAMEPNRRYKNGGAEGVDREN